ncbi:WRKY family transcription factor [Tanacetum coccineum]
MISVGECGERVSSWNLLIHASEALNICRRINWGGAQSGAGPKTALSVVNIVEPHSGRLYLRTHYEHKTLAMMSGVVNKMGAADGLSHKSITITGEIYGISVNSTLPASRDVKFGDETKQIHAMNEMNGRLCSTRRMRIRPATTKMLLIDNGDQLLPQPMATVDINGPLIRNSEHYGETPSNASHCPDTSSNWQLGSGTCVNSFSIDRMTEADNQPHLNCKRSTQVARKYYAVRKALLFQEVNEAGNSDIYNTAVGNGASWILIKSHVIYSTISLKLVEMIVDVDSTAYGVWKRLNDLFHDNKDARITQLDNEICNMSIGNSSITDFFQQIKSKADSLANLESLVKDSSLVTYAINGIRSKYPEAARVIRHREKAPTFDKLRSMMLLEESDMSHPSHGNSSLHHASSSPTVLVASTSNIDKANTMSTSGLDVCRNFQRGSCTYGACC